MAGYNPDDIHIAGLYTDAYSQSTSASVYANGQMQILIFPSCNYMPSGSGGQTQPTIAQYIYENTQIFVLADTGSMSLLDWQKSNISNEFEHNLNQPSASPQSKGKPHSKGKQSAAISDIRIPMYFTVPFDAAPKTYKLIAKLNGESTSTSAPALISVSSFSITADDFVIQDFTTKDEATMRVLKYTHSKIPSSQILVKCTEYRGSIFRGGASCWISLMRSSEHVCGAFLKYPDTTNLIAYNSTTYKSNEYTLNGIELSSAGRDLRTSDKAWTIYFDSNDLRMAWTQGIIMIKVHEDSLSLSGENWIADKFKMQDNYGNVIMFDIEFNYNDSSYKDWVVTNPSVVPP